MPVANSLVNTNKNKLETVSMSSFLTQSVIKERISKMLGEDAGLKFISSITSAVNTNPALQECTNTSIFNAALLGESLNLSPSPQLGQYYLVPYKNTKKEVTEAQFMLGYKGYIQLAIRSGQYKKLNVLAIKEGELISYNPLDEEINVRLIQDESEREKAKTIGYYAMFEYTNGFKKTMYWSKDKMIAHADRYSQAFSKDAKKGKKPEYDKVSFADYEAGKVPADKEWLYSSFWYKDFDGMAYKTMLRQLISKWGIMSIEMQQAYDSDTAVIKEDFKPEKTGEITEPAETPMVTDNATIDAEVINNDNPLLAGVE